MRIGEGEKLHFGAIGGFAKGSGGRHGREFVWVESAAGDGRGRSWFGRRSLIGPAGGQQQQAGQWYGQAPGVEEILSIEKELK